MKILINQYFGLGDIVFCMTIARRWIKEGHSITWPVLPQFVEGLQRAYPDVTFLDWREIGVNYERKDEHDWLDYRVVPLRWNVEIVGVPYSRCMESKYTMLQQDWREWKELAMWERDETKEYKLLSGIIPFHPTSAGPNPCDATPYRIINTTFGSDSRLNVDIPTVSDGADNIFMRAIDGFSLFDWAYALENASEIHTVSTSIIYILEMLEITCPIHIYKRHPIEKNHDNYSYILTKPNYILH